MRSVLLVSQVSKDWNGLKHVSAGISFADIDNKSNVSKSTNPKLEQVSKQNCINRQRGGPNNYFVFENKD